jgi:hypothetical protein
VRRIPTLRSQAEEPRAAGHHAGHSHQQQLLHGLFSARDMVQCLLISCHPHLALLNQALAWELEGEPHGHIRYSNHQISRLNLHSNTPNKMCMQPTRPPIVRTSHLQRPRISMRLANRAVNKSTIISAVEVVMLHPGLRESFSA